MRAVAAAATGATDGPEDIRLNPSRKCGRGGADKNSEPQQSASTEDEDLPKVAKVLEQIFRKPTRMAFKKAKLDIGNDGHRMWVLSSLAFAVYGGRGPGQPKRWTKRKLRRLRKRISEDPSDTRTTKKKRVAQRLLRKNKNIDITRSTTQRPSD